MKLSVCIHTYSDKPLNIALDNIKALGLDAVELCSGGYAGKYHCDPQALLKDSEALKKFRAEFQSRKITVTAFGCHGNSVHPNKEIAIQHDTDLRASIDLASKMDIKTVVTFSGCPGDHDGAKYPNWCLYPFPIENQEIWKYQWEQKLIPYWKEIGAYAEDRGVTVAIEMHGGFTVHTPATMIRLREETGRKSIGCNVDPSHLWWQGINPTMAIRHLAKADCIAYFHAKDTSIEQCNVDYYGLNDTQNFLNAKDRAWQFRSIGYGHDMKTWADIISTLRAIGYDGFVSIEHEDAMMSANEGFRRAIDNLKTVMITEKAYTPHVLSK
jgi:sugar phosphate isomerase/epimerase